MRNLNESGFALVETLIVSAFVLGIFTLLYTNYYPLIGEYEKRENYDSVDSVYKTNVIKRFIQTNRNRSITIDNPIYYQNAASFCTVLFSGDKVSECKQLWQMISVNEILLTKYTITDQKDTVKNKNDISNRMKEYVDYLPNYTTNQYNYKGRIIVEYKEQMNEADANNSYFVYKYATLGVDLYD